MTVNSQTVGVLTFATIWQASLFGISVETIAIATVPTLMGAVARVGLEMAKASDPRNGVKWGAVAALFGGTLISAPTIAVAYLICLKTAGVASDNLLFLGLIFFGFIGPKALLWLLNTFTTEINKRTGLKLPQIGPLPNEGSGP